MTPIRVGPDAIFHRFHSPDWAHLPTSGAGAAVNGGRFNRPGVEALYLSVEPETALAEYRQAATITPPATLVAYRVDVDGVVDFSGGYDPGARSDTGPRWVATGNTSPASSGAIRRHGDALIRGGLKGLLFPSYRHSGGTNLVLFSANLGPADRVTPHDPSGKLPRDQRSWT